MFTRDKLYVNDLIVVLVDLEFKSNLCQSTI